jgi:hypothetical protein
MAISGWVAGSGRPVAEIAAEQLGSALDRPDTEGAVAGWWFLRKHPVQGNRKREDLRF